MGKKKTKIGECVYCGNIKELTSEHVIPKCLFPNPKPANLVEVSACFDCNNKKSKNDDYLRDLLVSDIATSLHSIAQTIFHQKMLSSVRRGSSLFAKNAISTGKKESVYTPNGIYIGAAVVCQFDSRRVKDIFTQIIRGLYFKSRQKRIPDNYYFDVKRWHPRDFNDVWVKLQKKGFNGPYKIGEKVFTCLYIFADTDEFTTVWWLWFYESICISVFTKPETHQGP